MVLMLLRECSEPGSKVQNCEKSDAQITYIVRALPNCPGRRCSFSTLALDLDPKIYRAKAFAWYRTFTRVTLETRDNAKSGAGEWECTFYVY